MGLLPLEFSDCLLDSPYFRENLRAHEKQLERTYGDIKNIEKGICEVVEAAELLSKTKRSLATSLKNFQFDCLGTTLTDDEIIISNSLKEFAKFLNLVEDELDRMIEHAKDKFIVPLEIFRKEQIDSAKKVKKDFDKQTSRFCAAQDKYVSISSKKEESLAEAAEILRCEQKNLNISSLEYVYLMHIVQERKKVDFVEALMSFMQSWATYYKHGQCVTTDFSTYMEDLKSRVQKTRGNYSATIEQYDSLKQKMQSGHQDPGLLNKMYTRQGYLFVHNQKKNLKIGNQWTKHFCQYQAKSKILTLIPYNQISGKITNTEMLKVDECICKEENEKFRFIVNGEDLKDPGSLVTYTFQAFSDLERKQWVESMGGTWPAMNTLQRRKGESIKDNLNSGTSFNFIKDCIGELESRGLNDQGLYRVGGVMSKVKKLHTLGTDPNYESFNLSDVKVWESKTIASAIKQYFRDLSLPLMTHHLYGPFINAVKHDDEDLRIGEIQSVVNQMPCDSKEMLGVLVKHLRKVATNSDKNLMTASNLGVIFGPNLLRPREETVASIMDIKFCNEVVEILIENCDRFFSSSSSVQSSPEMSSSSCISARKNSTNSNCSMSVSMIETDHHQREKRGNSAPLRVNSIRSFSQLSTNSLPDIKEFKSPALISSTPIYHNKDLSTSEVVDTTRYNTRSSKAIRSYSNISIPRIGNKTSFNNGLLAKSSTEDDLMASLEMMNSLAADLPSASLKQPIDENIFQKKFNNKKDEISDMKSKPPLPKLSFFSTVNENNIPPHPHLFIRHNSSPSPSFSSNSEHSSSASASPRLLRTGDLLVRLQAQKQKRIEESFLENDEISTKSFQVPKVPARKYRMKILEKNLLPSTELETLSSDKILQQNENRKLEVEQVEEEVVCKEDEYSRRVSNVYQSDDAISTNSSAVSVISDTTVSSKYDNLSNHSTKAVRSQDQTKDEDGDDENSETSSLSENLHQGPRYGSDDYLNESKPSKMQVKPFPHPPPPPDLVPRPLRPQNNRFSGAYENVPSTLKNHCCDISEPFKKSSRNLTKHHIHNHTSSRKEGKKDISLSHPSTTIIKNQEEDSNDSNKVISSSDDSHDFSNDSTQGMTSLRNIMAARQTSNI